MRLLSWLRCKVRAFSLALGIMQVVRFPRPIRGRRAQAGALSFNSGVHSRLSKSLHVAKSPGQQAKLFPGLSLTLRLLSSAREVG